MKKQLAIIGFAILVIACGVWLWTSFPAPLPTVPHSRRAAPPKDNTGLDAATMLPSDR
jgi:hypothetical protein